MSILGSNAKIGGGGFHHVAIRTRDFDRSLQFYCAGLGFEPRYAWGEPGKRATLLDTGDGNYLEIFERPEQTWADSDAAILHMAFRSENVDRAIQVAREAGAEVTMEPRDVPIKCTSDYEPETFRIAFIKGPDGEVIEFFQNENL